MVNLETAGATYTVMRRCVQYELTVSLILSLFVNIIADCRSQSGLSECSEMNNSAGNDDLLQQCKDTIEVLNEQLQFEKERQIALE